MVINNDSYINVHWVIRLQMYIICEVIACVKSLEPTFLFLFHFFILFPAGHSGFKRVNYIHIIHRGGALNSMQCYVTLGKGSLINDVSPFFNFVTPLHLLSFY